jgi:hypothetical protein
MGVTARGIQSMLYVVPLLTGPETSLQSAVDRFARSLKVADSLYSLHARTSDPAFRSLRPAMVLCVVAAFEGFAEDFLAAALQKSDYTLHQIAVETNITSPDLERVEHKIDNLFQGAIGTEDDAFGLDLWRPPVGDSGWWAPVTLTWPVTKTAATAWIEVRHCLAHGVASGWESELWPSPRLPRGIRGREPKAAPSSVLRETGPGLYSLAIRCAINCCRIYRYGAQHLADQLAAHVHEGELDWSNVPDFPLE